jgi:hypothetical protein
VSWFDGLEKTPFLSASFQYARPKLAVPSFADLRPCSVNGLPRYQINLIRFADTIKAGKWAFDIRDSGLCDPFSVRLVIGAIYAEWESFDWLHFFVMVSLLQILCATG